MLSLGKFPTQVQYNTLLHNPVSQNLQFPSKPNVSICIRPNFLAVLGKMQSGLCCNALKTKKNGGFSLKEMDGLDEFEGDFGDRFLDMEEEEEEEEEGGIEVDGEDDEVVIPLKNMKKWIENKPRGFGEGKVYDTSIEDRLMEEIEQSRTAQLANINKLKNNPLKASSQKETVKKDKGPEIIQDGFQVRLVNLPKKKNIHKDLRLAFKEVSGIVDIVPVVSGNEKTRDPVCKGLAFVNFKNQDEAQRFIQNFSGKSISFGKVQKQIKCEMVNSNSDKALNIGVETEVSLSDSSRESGLSEGDYEDEMHVSGQREEEDDVETNRTSTTSDSNVAEEEDSGIDSSSPKQKRKVKKTEKKVASKGRKDKITKLSIPGSANKLKLSEKAVLTGVFSKYGANAASTVKERSRSQKASSETHQSFFLKREG